MSLEVFQRAFESELEKIAASRCFEAAVLDEMSKLAAFKSKAQQRFMFLRHPRIAKRWAGETKDFKKLPEHVADLPQAKAAHVMVGDHTIMPMVGRLPQPVPGEKLRFNDMHKDEDNRKLWKRIAFLTDDVVMAGMNMMRNWRGQGLE